MFKKSYIQVLKSRHPFLLSICFYFLCFLIFFYLLFPSWGSNKICITNLYHETISFVFHCSCIAPRNITLNPVWINYSYNTLVNYQYSERLIVIEIVVKPVPNTTNNASLSPSFKILPGYCLKRTLKCQTAANSPLTFVWEMSLSEWLPIAQAATEGTALCYVHVTWDKSSVVKLSRTNIDFWPWDTFVTSLTLSLQVFLFVFIYSF